MIDDGDINDDHDENEDDVATLLIVLANMVYFYHPGGSRVQGP